jgi:formate hydrogenlyase subunit 6/NADH:ubiquinone oxidoreductase subunit I
MTSDWALPTINMERCTGCGLCIDFCPTQAVQMIGDHPAITQPEKCAYCGLCEESCPVRAIELSYEIVWPQKPHRAD